MIDLTWLDNDESIMEWKFAAGWSAAELVAAFEEYVTRIEGRTAPVALLLDLTEAGRMPSGMLRTFPQLGRSLSEASVKASAIAVLAETSRHFDALIRIFNRVYSRSMETFKDREVALKHLQTTLEQARAEQE